jgi:hypothetical protein
VPLRRVNLEIALFIGGREVAAEQNKPELEVAYAFVCASKYGGIE